MADHKSCLLLLIIQLFSKINSQYKRLNKDELNVVVLGDIGYTEKVSKIKRNVVAAISRLHKKIKFDLGLILGDNAYENGVTNKTVSKLYEIFTNSFPKAEFDFDFLVVLGNHDYLGSIEAQMFFHRELEHRFYLPGRSYSYDVYLEGLSHIRFIATDSNPLLGTEIWRPKLFSDPEQEMNITQLLYTQPQPDYTFLLSHHDIDRGFGPHNFVPLNSFYKKIDLRLITAVFNGHNHNFQYHPPTTIVPTHRFTVGNSARMQVVSTTVGSGWFDDKTGGFGHLFVTEQVARFRFVNEYGREIHVVRFSPSGNPLQITHSSLHHPFSARSHHTTSLNL